MPERDLVVSLAKLLVAAAWVDGELQNTEINALKDLLFTLEDVSGDEWAELEIYMDSPVSPREREELLERVVSRIKSEDDRELVVRTVENLLQADGIVTDEEKVVFEEIRRGVSDVRTGILARLSKMMRGAVAERNQRFDFAVQRENQIDDYVKNTVYYQLQSEAQSKGIEFNMPEETLRKLCLAGGLLARISAVDAEISSDEKQAITKILSAEWGLPEAHGQLVTETSCSQALQGLDYFRLTRGFFECTTIDERKGFVRSLFKIANASGKTSHDEVEEIRRIAGSLKLAHTDFIEAKLTIPDEDREVL